MTVPSKGRQRKRCGIYCIYAKYGHVARYVDYFLSKLVKSLDQLVIVANGELDADSRKRLERFADRIMFVRTRALISPHTAKRCFQSGGASLPPTMRSSA